MPEKLIDKIHARLYTYLSVRRSRKYKTVLLPREKIAYYPVPKNACTTIKKALFIYIRDDTGLRENFLFPLSFPFRWRRTPDIHAIYASHPFFEDNQRVTSGWFRFAIVRDPLERVLSYYFLTMGRGKITGAPPGFDKWPGPDTFVGKIAYYRKISADVYGHTRPQHYFLGHKPEHFSRLYNMNQWSELEQELNRRCNGNITFPWTHKNPVPAEREYVSQISDKSKQRLRDYYAEDYRIFGKYFSTENN